MTLQDAIDKAPQKLRDDVRHWWMTHRDDLADVLVSDATAAVVRELQRGESMEARLELAATMTRAEWRAYRDNTTAELDAAVHAKAALIRSLRDLGRVGAMALGSIIAGAAADATAR